MNGYVQAAFNQVCAEAKQPERRYVCLVEEWQAYGGPEEGGWWYTCQELAAYKAYDDPAEAQAAIDKIGELAVTLNAQARSQHGRQMLREMAWCDARGLDADFLPEPDGPTTYSVQLHEELPEFNNRRPRWE